MTILSICIPTYNRRKCLEYLLNSIEPQYSFEVEIVISDNLSADGTKELIEETRQRFPITYFCFDKQVPCGENLLKAVSLAKSRYCWLMSDDDAFEKNAFSKVLKILKENPYLTGISVNVQGFDKEMRFCKEIKYSHDLKNTILFKDPEEGFEKLGAWMGFWSAHIIDKKKWDKAKKDKEYLMIEGYHHLYLMGRMLKENPSWLFLHHKLVAYRADHESFSKEYGRFHRFMIDIKAYKKTGSLFSCKSCIAVEKKVLKKLLFWQLLRAKCESLTFMEVIKMLKISFSAYKGYIFYWGAIIPLLCVPSFFLRLIRKVYRKIKQQTLDETVNRYSHI